MNSTSGEIFTLEPLDREAVSMYELLITAADEDPDPETQRSTTVPLTITG